MSGVFTSSLTGKLPTRDRFQTVHVRLHVVQSSQQTACCGCCGGEPAQAKFGNVGMDNGSPGSHRTRYCMIQIPGSHRRRQACCHLLAYSLDATQADRQTERQKDRQRVVKDKSHHTPGAGGSCAPRSGPPLNGPSCASIPPQTFPTCGRTLPATWRFLSAA